MTVLEAYQQYAAAGFKCLPTKADKSPDVKGTWKGGVSDPEAFIKAHGIGIICGSISGNLECLDFDNHFGDAKENLSEFLADPEVKEIYKSRGLPIEKTVSGGFHLLLLCKTIAGNQKLAQRPKKQGERWVPDTIIETRGEGGYFCADPTPGYQVIRNSILQVPEITPEERGILLSKARSFNTWNDVRRNEYEQGEKPGDLYNSMPEAIEEMKSALSGAGWKELSPGIWQRPGKKKGISATLGKVAPNVFYCFTSNGHPFNENSGYTPFQVCGLLNHNGDFKDFAKELAERYDMNRPSSSTPQQEKRKEEKKRTINFDDILNRAYIDLDVEVAKPPVIMKIRDKEATSLVDKRLFTLGNFSCTTGKSKSKKTFLSTMFLAAAASGEPLQGKFIPDLPQNKQAVLLFDTEQSRYDSWVTSHRIPRLLGYLPENFGAFDLREYSPRERCDIIEFALNKFKDSLGFIVIDGIADLATAINDEEEASRVVSLLMRWTKVFNCHIHTIIHENKNDNYATGHLGSAILKKAEAIISVKKDPDNYRRSFVSCNLIRGTADFNDFDFVINDEGLPQVEAVSKSSIEMENYYEPVKDEF